jgi:hypothetical protein
MFSGTSLDVEAMSPGGRSPVPDEFCNNHPTVVTRDQITQASSTGRACLHNPNLLVYRLLLI